MIKKKFKIPLYFGDLTIIQIDDLSKIEKQYSLKSCANFQAITFKDPTSNYLKLIVAFNEATNFRTVAHEALHILNWIYTERGIEYDFYNDEPAAYLLGWIVEQIENTIIIPPKKIKNRKKNLQK